MNSEFMNLAIAEAEKASALGEIPVGAVIVKDGRVIAAAHNLRETKKSALSHAECEAIAAANKALGDWRLNGCTMYVTLEPCTMCMGAIINSRISELVFGAYDLPSGAVYSRVDYTSFAGSLPTVYAGIKEDECKKLLEKFFNEVRNDK